MLVSSMDILTYQLLLQNNQKSLPIDITKLAMDNGFKIITIDMQEGETGFVLVDDNEELVGFQTRRLIGVKKGLEFEKRRFVTAHEFAHFILHKGEKVQYMHRSVEHSEKPEEKEADLFARCLLMPAKLIKDKMSEFKDDNGESTVDEIKIKYISLVCRVTETKAKVRLQELGFLG